MSIQGLVLVAKPYYNEVWCPVVHFGAQTQVKSNLQCNSSFISNISKLLCMYTFRRGLSARVAAPRA